MTFSKVLDDLKSAMQITDEICPEHQLPIQKVAGTDIIIGCEKCALEAHQAREAREVAQWTEDALKAGTYSWLGNRSILLDTTLRSASFDSYMIEDEETSKNKELALKIARDYWKGETYNTVLTGKAGTGKSHLSMSILKAVNEHSNPPRKCLFVSVDELLRRIKSSFDNPISQDTEGYLVQMMTEADLLVLDDLGAETGAMNSHKQATDFTIRVLYAIANGRMTKPTIVTTNLGSKELSQMYDAKLVSRLLKGSKGHTLVFNNTTDKRLDF